MYLRYVFGNGHCLGSKLQEDYVAFVYVLCLRRRSPKTKATESSKNLKVN